jgi:hypothetical protein
MSGRQSVLERDNTKPWEKRWLARGDARSVPRATMTTAQRPSSLSIPRHDDGKRTFTTAMVIMPACDRRFRLQRVEGDGRPSYSSAKTLQQAPNRRSAPLQPTQASVGLSSGVKARTSSP